MSLSQPTLKNPAVRFYDWQGSTGKIKYYDRETKENVVVELPFTFIVLDRLATVSGFSKARHSGLWANEVRSTMSEPITLRSNAGIEFQGLYADLEKKVEGSKYTASVYVAVKNAQGKFELANFRISGAALKPWIDFSKATDVEGAAITIAETEHDKNGSVEFERPVFSQVKRSEAALKAALALDVELQAYLASYFAQSPKAGLAAPEIEEATKEEGVTIQELASDNDETPTNNLDSEEF